MTITVHNITGDAWTPITAAGKSGTCWLQEIPGKGQVVINHSDTLTEFNVDESYFLLNAKRKLQWIGAESDNDIYYAKCRTPGTQAVLITDTGFGFIHDPAGKFTLDPDGSLRVRQQDPTTPIVIVPLHQKQGETTLAADAIIDTYTVELTDATGFIDGNLVALSDIVNSQVYFGKQIGAPVGNVITVDRPFDFTFVAGLIITRNRTNMNIDGSAGTEVFGLRQGLDPGLNLTADVVRILMTMYTGTTPTLGDFGDISGGITTGVTFRKRDGNRVNVFNIKDNGELAGICYDLQFLSAIGGGQDGLTSRLTFGGESKMGAVIRVAPDEDVELLVNDDLTSLEKFELIIEGSIVLP